MHKAWLRRRTLYAVTDRRIIKLVRRRTADAVDASFVDAIPAVTRDLRHDGSGSVIFGPTSPEAGASSAFAGFAVAKDQTGALAFEDISDAARVADLVTELRRSRAAD